jgi:predicted Zn-dependent protease with MMP-like domain
MTLQHAGVVARVFRERLPVAVREKLAGVAILVQTRPPAELLADGLCRPDEEGLYLQQGDEEDAIFWEGEDLRRAIYVFLENLRPPTEARLLEVLAHEVGHACGFDELELEALGLGAPAR